MIYTKNKQTNEIKTFEVDNYLQLIKNIRDQFIEATQEEIDLYLLQEAKDAKLAEIQTAKEIDLYLNVSYNNKDFISSEKAVSNMTGAIILNQDSYNWLDANGNPNIMTVNDLRNLIGIIATQRSLIYNKEALKIKAVNDSQTIEEVNNINWESDLDLDLGIDLNLESSSFHQISVR
jgi:hypothetical protein